MLKEFKKFVTRGSSVDMAIGVVIGGAFNRLVAALTTYIINPFIGLFMGQINLSSWIITVGGAQFRLGNMLSSIIEFLILMYCTFLAVKGINYLRQNDDEQEEGILTKDQVYLREIRDMMAKETDSKFPSDEDLEKQNKVKKS